MYPPYLAPYLLRDQHHHECSDTRQYQSVDSGDCPVGLLGDEESNDGTSDGSSARPHVEERGLCGRKAELLDDCGAKGSDATIRKTGTDEEQEDDVESWVRECLLELFPRECPDFRTSLVASHTLQRDRLLLLGQPSCVRRRGGKVEPAKDASDAGETAVEDEQALPTEPFRKEEEP